MIAARANLTMIYQLVNVKFVLITIPLAYTVIRREIISAMFVLINTLGFLTRFNAKAATRYIQIVKNAANLIWVAVYLAQTITCYTKDNAIQLQ